MEQPNAAQSHSVAKRNLIETLFNQGLMTQGNRLRALDDIMPPLAWGVWIARILTILGSAFLLIGGSYLVIFNWGKFSYINKFVVLHAAIIIAVLAALLVPVTKLHFKLFLASCCIFLAVIIGVYSQAYQAAHDGYLYFFIWSALALGWVVCARLELLWVLWLALANFSFYLWWLQTWTINNTLAMPFLTDMSSFYFISLFFNGAILILFETLNKRQSWLTMTKLRPVAVLYCCYLALMGIMLLGSELAGIAWDKILVAFTSLGVLFYFLYYYRFKSLSIWALSLSMLTLCISFVDLLFVVFDNIINLPTPATVVALGLISILLFAFVSLYIKRVYSQGGEYA